jgi:hypothetical protein
MPNEPNSKRSSRVLISTNSAQVTKQFEEQRTWATRQTVQVLILILDFKEILNECHGTNEFDGSDLPAFLVEKA